jgi:hypothetical protein
MAVGVVLARGRRNRWLTERLESAAYAASAPN